MKPDLTSSPAPSLSTVASRLPLLLALLLAAPFTARSAETRREPGLGNPADVPRLIETVRRTDASVAEKARACQQLAIVGNRDAVPALVPLLSDPVLGAYARAALQALPDPAADAALRQALQSLDGDSLIGVVHSIGARQDPMAVGALRDLVSNRSRGAAPDALLALARIGTPEAHQTIREALANGPAELRAAAAEGALICAESEMAQGHAGRAMAFFDSVRESNPPRPLVLAAIRGAILVRGASGIPLLLRQWRSAEADAVALAARVSRELTGPEVSRALADALPSAPPTVQVLLLQVLADRGDSAVRDAVELTATSETLPTRIAALQTLGKVGDLSSVPVLLRALGSGATPAEAEAASSSLVQIPARKADQAILDALDKSEPETRSRMIAILGYRKATGATDALLRQAAHPSPDVARAAFEALAVVAQPDDLAPVLRAGLACPHPDLREKAEHAMYSVAIKDEDSARRGRAMASAFRSAREPAQRASLLQVAALVADATSFEIVAAAYQDSDPAVRDTALRLLAHWPDATPAPLLLQVFKKSDTPIHRTLALRGVVTLGTLWTEQGAGPGGARPQPPAKAVEWMAEASAALRDNADEKRTLLSGLASFACARGLELIRPFLEDPSVRREASVAFLQAAKGLSNPDDARLARPVAEKIASTTQDADLRQQAQDVLKTLSR